MTDTDLTVEEFHFSTKMDLVFLVLPRHIPLNKRILWLYLVGFYLRKILKNMYEYEYCTLGSSG
jgi:hypothetical protein